MIDVVDNRFSKIKVGFDKTSRKSLRNTKRAINRAKRLVGLTNKIIRDRDLETFDKFNVTEIFDSEDERKNRLKRRRENFKEKQRRRRELLKNKLVRQKASFRDKKRLEIFGKGKLYLERYIKNEDGDIIKNIDKKSVNLNSSSHLLNSKVDRYGIRLVYVELANESSKTSPTGQEVDTSKLKNLPSKEDAYMVTDSEFLSHFDYKADPKEKKHKRYWERKSDDRKKTYAIKNAIPKHEKERKFFVHPISTFEVNADEILELLGIDRDNKDSVSCFALEGFTGSGIEYSEHTLPEHYHEYEVDSNGNGFTTTVLSGDSAGEVIDHIHEIENFKIMPETYSETKGRKKIEINHVHEFFQDTDISEEQDSVVGRVSKKIFQHMLHELRDQDDFRVMFEYCFNLQDVSSVVTSYSFLANTTREMLKVFDVTKRRMENFLFNASSGSNYFNSTTGCNENQMAKSLYNMGNSNMDDVWNPSLLLFLLMTPLHIYKGWSKTADPHVFITQTIVELGQAGFLIPKLEKKNVEIPFHDPIKCQEVTVPTFPGEKITIPGFTQLVALAVTYAPLLVTLPPFPPTPFGLVYYLLVDPLLQLMSPWANELMMNDPNLQRALSDNGLDFSKEAILCLPGEVTPIDEKDSSNESDSDDNDDDCGPLGPSPVDVGGYGKSNC